MGIDWSDGLKQKAGDERIYRAIKTGDWRTALMELFRDVRQVRICEHGNMTSYERCPQCDDELDRLGGL